LTIDLKPAKFICNSKNKLATWFDFNGVRWCKTSKFIVIKRRFQTTERRWGKAKEMLVLCGLIPNLKGGGL
jgi:hypothetical protein